MRKLEEMTTSELLEAVESYEQGYDKISPVQRSKYKKNNETRITALNDEINRRSRAPL